MRAVGRPLRALLFAAAAVCPQLPRLFPRGGGGVPQSHHARGGLRCSIALLQQAAPRRAVSAASPSWRHTVRGLRRQLLVRRAADPDFMANVGQAIDALREDHVRIPAVAPGLSVADPQVVLEIAQLPTLRFQGLKQYREFWDNFRAGVQLVSTAARSEVVQVVHSGLYIRLRWRLLLAPRVPLGGQAVGGALRAARTSLDQAVAGGLGSSPDSLSSKLGGWLQQAGKDLLGEAERLAAGAALGVQERNVELNSVYELDSWSGRVVRHTLEFRSPGEDFGLLGALQGVPSYR